MPRKPADPRVTAVATAFGQILSKALGRAAEGAVDAVIEEAQDYLRELDGRLGKARQRGKAKKKQPDVIDVQATVVDEPATRRH